MMAIVPIPIIGLGMPTQEINEIKADDVLSKCGPPERLVNRRVEVDRTACIPTVLTRCDLVRRVAVVSRECVLGGGRDRARAVAAHREHQPSAGTGA